MIWVSRVREAKRKERKMKAANEIKKYTVEITKLGGLKSIYYVAALSGGGAEQVALMEVYEARYAVATLGWPKMRTQPDLTSKGAARVAVAAVLA